jgi:hypothetical protein
MSEIGIIWLGFYLLLVAGIIKIFLKILSQGDVPTCRDSYKGFPKTK